jgi:hypothetical protein
MQRQWGWRLTCSHMERLWCLLRWGERHSRGILAHVPGHTVPTCVNQLRCWWDGRLIFAGEGTIVEYEGRYHALFSRGKCVKAFILMSQRIKRLLKRRKMMTSKALPPTESTFHLSNKHYRPHQHRLRKYRDCETTATFSVTAWSGVRLPHISPRNPTFSTVVDSWTRSENLLPSSSRRARLLNDSWHSKVGLHARQRVPRAPR